MKTVTKALIGTVAAGAMAVSAASPALARDNGGLKAGELIAGALVIGGIAAIAASAGKNDRDDRYDADYAYGRAGYGNDRYGFGDPRQAQQICVNAAERGASRYGRANVTEVRSVRQTRSGYEVKGRIAVNDRGYRTNASYGGRGWNNADTGSFTCDVRRGQVTGLDYSGIRGR